VVPGQRREVKNELPFVIKDGEVGSFCLLAQARVSHVEGAKFEASRGLNNRVIRRVKVHSRVVEVSAAELLASDVHCAVLAVAQKDRPLDGPDHEGAVLALVYGHLRIAKSGISKSYTCSQSVSQSVIRSVIRSVSQSVSQKPI